MQLPRKLEKLAETSEQALSRWQDAVQGRRAREERIEAARKERTEALRRGQEKALLPGGADAGVAVATATAEAIEAEVARLDGEEARARHEYETARAAYDAGLRELIPGAVAEGDGAETRALAALGVLGRAALRVHSEVTQALGTRVTSRRDLEELLSRLSSGDDGRLTHAQQAEVRAHVKAASRGPASPEQLIGFLVWRALEWSRLQSTGLEGFWTSQGPGPRSGSALYTPALTEADVFALRDRRINIEGA